MKSVLVALGVSGFLSGAAFAQTEGHLCYHAGLSYSPGSMIVLGKSLQKCVMADAGISAWSPVVAEDDALESANCISGGREFSHGSIQNIGTADLKCSKGLWYVR